MNRMALVKYNMQQLLEWVSSVYKPKFNEMDLETLKVGEHKWRFSKAIMSVSENKALLMTVTFEETSADGGNPDLP